MKPHKISTHSAIVIFIFSMGCLIELKLCEVSRDSFSNWFWKFQLSILKNKSVLFLKKYSLRRYQYHYKKALFTDSIFSEGFGFWRPKIYILIRKWRGIWIQMAGSGSDLFCNTWQSSCQYKFYPKRIGWYKKIVIEECLLFSIVCKRIAASLVSCLIVFNQ